MIHILAIFAVAYAASSPFTNADFQFRKDSFTNLDKHFSEIDSAIDRLLADTASGRSPQVDCTLIRRGIEAILRYAPPKECPKTKKFFNFYLGQMKSTAGACDKFSALFSKLSALKSQNSCRLAREEAGKAMKSLNFESESDSLSDAELDTMDSDSPSGEMRVMKCQIAAMSVMQARKKLLSNLNRLDGVFHSRIDEVCETLD